MTTTPFKIDRVLSWADDLDERTINQAQTTASMPFVEKPLALMPDAHLGFGSTVGSVVATSGAIMPACVGVDIGCGMIAQRLNSTGAELGPHLEEIHALVERVVPSGIPKGGNKSSGSHQEVTVTPALSNLLDGLPDAANVNKVASQFGTLGSGNHFVEICADSDTDDAWIVLHSGSRNAGNTIARTHIEHAKGLMKSWFIELPDPDLAYLVEGTADFEHYIADMTWAQQYAFENRQAMMDAIVVELVDEFHDPDILAGDPVNCFGGDTEIITRHGTRRIEEMVGAKHELLTDNGEWVKAPIKSFGFQEVYNVTLSRSGAHKTILATVGHRWLTRSRQRNVRHERTTLELQAGDRLEISFPNRPPGMRPSPEGIRRGFVFGDGSGPTSSYSRSSANFCGLKDDQLLGYFGGVGNAPRSYYGIKRITGLPAEWKTEYPSLDGSPDDIYGWLAGYFAADGDVDRTGRPTLTSASRANLEFARLACQTVGIGTFGIREHTRITSYSNGERVSIYLVGFMRGDLDERFFLVDSHRERFEAGRNAVERRGWNVVSVSAHPVDRVEVFCAVVDRTHSFALADNVLVGNCHHNYTTQERHHGKNLWITRKGAILARQGALGVIPGSMATGSFIVEGLGSSASYCSASHGAGRKMSRTAARKNLTANSLALRMDGIAWNEDSQALLDEHPEAYKDLGQVMENQADLVRIKHRLDTILNYKGI